MRKFFYIFIILLLVSCDNDKIKLSEEEMLRYNTTLQQIEEVEKLYAKAERYKNNGSLAQLMEMSESLAYDYNDKGMNHVTIQHCDSLRDRVAKLKSDCKDFYEHTIISSGKIDLMNIHNNLIEGTVTYPVYLNQGELLFYNVRSEISSSVKIYNYDARRMMKQYANRQNVNDSLRISFSGIYLIEIIPGGSQYCSVDIACRPCNAKDIYYRPEIKSEVVACNKGDFGYKATQGVKMYNCFDEARKFTLRGQLKAVFSGASTALVAVQIPSNATDILYSLRIATSEQDRSSDGEFYDDLTYSYSKIKFLGLPIYERSKSNGLLKTLLDDNRPIREEDAYCNMYVFRNTTQAKQFQDGTKKASELNYDVDYSTLGTQSCNGRIPVNGLKTIYLAFENERVRYTNYIWVEAVAIVPVTEYHKTEYTIQ
ncbi:MAG: hypothetical protein J6Q39_03360 [Bacteroidales bacterium]|nr:hypothetical protein [Bacteroidales bacterium]